MTILFAANEVDAFKVANPLNVLLDTTAGVFDPDYAVGGAMTLTNNATLTADFAAQTEGWAHFEHALDTVSTAYDNEWLELIDSTTGQAVVWMDINNAVPNFQYWNGAADTIIGASWVVKADERTTYDIHWKIADAGGFFRLYKNGNLHRSFEGDTLLTGFTTIDQLRISSHDHNGTGTCYITEVIIDTAETLEKHVSTISPNAIGTTNTFDSGLVADIDDIVIADDTNFLASAIADQIATFAASNLSANAATVGGVEAVVSALRGRNAATGPQNIQMAMRSGVTDYFSASVTGLGVGFDGFFDVRAVDPDTSVAWTTAGVDALELGAKSIA